MNVLVLPDASMIGGMMTAESWGRRPAVYLTARSGERSTSILLDEGEVRELFNWLAIWLVCPNKRGSDA